MVQLFDCKMFTDLILNEVTDILVLSTTAEVVRVGAVDRSTVSLTRTRPYTVISKYPVTSILWYIIIAIIMGILLLTLVAYTLYRVRLKKN